MVNLEQELEQPQGSSATFTASSVPGVDAAQVRVTPEELTQALSAVESRREQPSQHLASTIRLGEAVDQLGLHVTPEELLAEIAEQRARALYPPIIVRKRLSKWQRRGYVAALCVTMFFASLTAFYFLTASPLTTPVREVAATIQVAPPSFPYLSAVPDGKVVQCDLETLHSLAKGALPTQTRVVEGELRNATGTWSIVKRNGKILVRCFATEAESVRLLNGHGGVVRPNNAEQLAIVVVEPPITLFKDAVPQRVPSSRYAGKLVDTLRIPEP